LERTAYFESIETLPKENKVLSLSGQSA